jgi:hypothetical protein
MNEGYRRSAIKSLLAIKQLGRFGFLDGGLEFLTSELVLALPFAPGRSANDAMSFTNFRSRDKVCCEKCMGFLPW